MYLCGTRYKVIGRLGEGGFGRVYLAEDTLLGNTWAIKETGSVDDVSYSSIKAEISVLSRSSHPGIVRITDVFRSEGHVYIVMDHVAGKNLKEILQSKKKIPEKIIFRWCVELCEAVSYLHHMDPPVIMCDIKPQNIMVRPDGHIILIDFGAALNDRINNAPSFGSKKYASPEQAAGQKPDIKSDIYSLGRVIDDMTGNNKPFGIKAVIKRCTMKNPRLRYRSVNAVRRDIKLCADIGIAVVCVAVILLAGTFFIMNAKKSTEKVNETAMEKQAAKQAYEQALLCFYELDDYKAAEKYLDKVPASEYPEAEYYMELSDILSAGVTDNNALYEVLDRFGEYNEGTVKKDDRDRYVKNIFCMAKACIASDQGGNGYERAYALAGKVLDLYGDETADTTGYKEDALRLMINISILEGRTDGADMAGNYHRAIKLIDDLISLPSVNADRSCVIAKRMDEAALYTELEEYKSAMEVYAMTENDYPRDPGINYLAHLSLLMQTGAPRSDILSLWSEASGVEGIKDSSNFSIMEERISGLTQ